MATLEQLESGIREYINRTRQQSRLMSTPVSWNRLCSALDVLGDTEVALESYLNQKEIADLGERYLIVYGVFQVLFVQQDAAKAICECLGLFSVFDADSLQSIRELRNDAVGHPTLRSGTRTSSFISRVTLTHDGFQLMRTGPDDQINFADIHLPDLISKQRSILHDLLLKVVQALREEELEHRKKFRKTPLTEVFPSTLNYSISKIAEAIPPSGPAHIANISISELRKALEQFEAELTKRGLTEAPFMSNGPVQYLRRALSRLEQYFQDPGGGTMTDKDSYIYWHFIRSAVEELRQIAREIDEEYAQDPD